MDRKKRERLIRAIVAGILTADFDVADLRRLANEARNDQAFVDDLLSSLTAVLAVLEPVTKRISYQIPPERGYSSPHEDIKGDLEQIVDLIHRRHMSKKQVVALLKNFDPSYSLRPLDYDSITVRELLSEFIRTRSRESLIRFIEDLGLKRASDPYLEGIGQRR